jgi:lambda family phage portal protein
LITTEFQKTRAAVNHFAKMADKTGSNRQQTINAAYDSAQTTSKNSRNWRLSDSLSADEANSPYVRQILRKRARYECLEANSYAKGIVHTLAMDLIGAGPRLQVQTKDKKANERIEKSWSSWAKRTKLARKLQTMRVSKCVDGEAFGEMVNNPRLRHRVQLDLHVTEGDQYTTPHGIYDPEHMIDGMHFDDFGNVEWYHRVKQHPGGPAMFDTNPDVLPADQIIHLFRQDRPGQHRGIPEVTTALPLFNLLRQYSLAALSSAQIAAKFTAVVQTNASAVNSSGDSYDPKVQPYDLADIDYDMITHLPFGWNMQQFKPEQPTNTHDEFVKSILREISRCVHMPLMIASGDASDHNYSSGRLDVQTYQMALDIERAYWETECLDRLFEAWMDEAILTGIITEDFPVMDEVPHVWTWGNRDHVDPSKEADATDIKLANFSTSLAREYAKQNLDWEVEVTQIARERAKLKELELADVEPKEVDPKTDSSGTRPAESTKRV